MKKYISYILLAISLFAICLTNVSALEFDNDSIVLPNELKEGSNSISFVGFDNYSKKYQILKVSSDSDLIQYYNDYIDASDDTSKEENLAYLESEIESSIQEDGDWADVTNNTFNFDGDLEAGAIYLVVVKAIETDTDDGNEYYGYELYPISNVNSSEGAATENKDTGINDTLLIIGVPMLLIAGVYLSTKKQYN